MAKHSGFKALKKMKKIKSSQTVRAQKISVLRDDLESTPDEPGFANPGTFSDKQRSGAFEAFPEKQSMMTDRRAKDASKNAAVKQSRGPGRRARYRKKNLFAVVSGALSAVFTKRSPENAALDFAVNHRRKSKKEKRQRLVLVYGGAGLVLAVVVLVAALAPKGAAAPAGADPGPAQEPLMAAAEQAEQTGVATAALAAKMPSIMPFSAAFASEPVWIAQPFSEFTEPDDGLTAAETAPETQPTPVATTAPDPTHVPVKAEDFLDYFVVTADAYYNDKNYSSNAYEYTHEEYLMLARIIHGEARGQSFKGQVAVGNVIMNRVLCRGAWPRDVISVVAAPGQFTPYNKVKDMSESQISSGAKRAARAVLDKEIWVVPQDTYFFRSAGRYSSLRGENWGSHKYFGEVGGHFYYTHSYSGRHRGGDVPPALFDRTYKYPQYGCKPEKRVYRIQYMLNKLGYDVKADSYFGKTSKEALIEFQKKYDLSADGIAGPSTIKRLIEEFGVSKYYEKFVK